jgi:Putative amidoligase enzyme
MRARHFIISESELFEINMSPGNLKQLAGKIDARVGMEFEMIVPNVETDDNAESEPDYGPDERVRGWQSIESFFNDSDHNSRASIGRLHDELFQEYTESDYWQEAEQSWWEENEEYYVEQAVEKELGEELWQEAADQLGDRKFADERDRKNAIEEIYSTLIADRRDESINNNDEIYDLARDDAMEESEPDHETGFNRFLRNSYSYMTDIESSFSHLVTWPYWELAGDDDADVSKVANDFEGYVNMKVDYSQSYHGAKRRPDAYVVEPDSSLDGDNPGDTGLEFVSPPLTLEQMTQHLEAVKEYARDNNCYTNRTTGLHINVSVPKMNMDNLDYVKLALLLGDKYVLEQFGRSANTYCKSAMDEILSRAKSNRNQVPGLLDMMKAGLNKLAGKMIHSGSTGKYISINNKEKYIEFRSPGGDWLNTDLDKIVSTMNRFVVALDAAVDPAKYKEEYSKKLYKVIAPENASDTIKYFAKYAAGALPKAALKSFLKQAKLEREVKKKTDDGKLYYWNVTVPGSSASLQVVAANRNDAWSKAIGYEGYPEWGRRFDAAAATIQVIKPYTGDTTPDNRTPQDDQRDSPVGKYEVVSSEGRTLETYTAGSYQEALARMNREWESSIRYGSPVTLRPVMGPGGGTASQTSRSRLTNGSITAPESMPDANYAIIRVADNVPIRYFTASTQQEAEQEYARWRQHTGAWEVEFYLISINPRPERRLDGSMTAPESDPDANFAVIRSSDNAVINYFTRNTRQEADRAFAIYLTTQGLATSTTQAASLMQHPESLPYYIIAIRPRSAPESRADHGQFTGRWNIVTDQNQVIHTFGGVNTQAEANAHARQWLERNSRYAQLGLTVVPDRV